MNPGVAAAALACHGIAREAGELTRAALLYPLGCTALGSRAVMRALVPDGERGGRHRTPVVLVHGYGGNPSSWFPLQQRLLRAGFAHVHAISYNAAIADLPAIGRIVARSCTAAMQRSGTNHLHLVGHSLGGVGIRHAIQQLGLAPYVRTAVTVATPHRGLPLVLTGWASVVRFLQPGRHRPGDLSESNSPSGVRWVNFYSDHDLVVRPGSARIQAFDGCAQNILVPRAGHIGILPAPVFLDGVVRELLEDERGSGLEPTWHDHRARSEPPSLGGMSEAVPVRYGRENGIPVPRSRSARDEPVGTDTGIPPRALSARSPAARRLASGS